MVVKGYGRATRSVFGPETLPSGYTVYQLSWMYDATATLTVSDSGPYTASYAIVYPVYTKIAE
jgi:hypothetical protein